MFKKSWSYDVEMRKRTTASSGSSRGVTNDQMLIDVCCSGSGCCSSSSPSLNSNTAYSHGGCEHQVRRLFEHSPPSVFDCRCVIRSTVKLSRYVPSKFQSRPGVVPSHIRFRSALGLLYAQHQAMTVDSRLENLHSGPVFDIAGHAYEEGFKNTMRIISRNTTVQEQHLQMPLVSCLTLD